METQASRLPVLAWVAAISLIVASGVGVAALMGWIPTSLGNPDALVLRTVEQPVAQAPDHRTRDRERARGVEREKVRDRTKRAPAPAAAAARCTGCGVVQSVREVKVDQPVESAESAESAKSYEITVDLEDGTNRVITQASAPTWRSGDKVRIVNGVIESNA